ncbi:MAG: hypothetical protein HYS06_01160 [Methylocystis sp.]|nr:hypothetical protein [Methylocystis sp.]
MEGIMQNPTGKTCLFCCSVWAFALLSLALVYAWTSASGFGEFDYPKGFFFASIAGGALVYLCRFGKEMAEEASKDHSAVK